MQTGTSRKRSRRRSPHHGGCDAPALRADLFVPLPPLSVVVRDEDEDDEEEEEKRSSPVSERAVLVRQLSQRLQTAGYKVVAFTHTVYGKPKDPEDRVDVALPEESLLVSSKKNNSITGGTSSTCAPGLRVLRRLHAVIENLSDVAYYTPQSAAQDASSLLQGYDLVSIAPRNEAVFRSVIAGCAGSCDILTLDYTGQRSGLPYRVRGADVQTLVEGQWTLELTYAPALLQPTWRKPWIQASAAVLQASRRRSSSTRPVLLASSSGSRRTEHKSDAAALAIRMPRDVENLATTVLGWSSTHCGAAAQRTLTRARKRRYGTSAIEEIEYGEHPQLGLGSDKEKDHEEAPKLKKEYVAKHKLESKEEEGAEDSGDDAGDGFISF